jgi:hypothetical protein
MAQLRRLNLKMAGLLARAFLSAFPVSRWQIGQAHVPYSRGGGTGISPASRFTSDPFRKHHLKSVFALHHSQVNGAGRNATCEHRRKSVCGFSLNDASAHGFKTKKSRDEPGFKVWSEPFPAKTSRGEHSRRANGRRRCALEMIVICPSVTMISRKQFAMQQCIRRMAMQHGQRLFLARPSTRDSSACAKSVDGLTGPGMHLAAFSMAWP